MADLYVYFYEQGLHLLRPGGRLGYVVTNKWLKAGYAENLRELFTEDAWLEFVGISAMRGTSSRRDVFPSVLVVRKPTLIEDAPDNAEICVVSARRGAEARPRGSCRRGDIPAPARDVHEGKLGSRTEAGDGTSKKKLGVMESIYQDYTGTKPYRGVTTGFNDAFFIDAEKREIQSEFAKTQIVTKL